MLYDLARDQPRSVSTSFGRVFQVPARTACSRIMDSRHAPSILLHELLSKIHDRYQDGWQYLDIPGDFVRLARDIRELLIVMLRLCGRIKIISLVVFYSLKIEIGLGNVENCRYFLK